MTLAAVVAIALAFVLDAAFSEPPVRAHPVAWFGRIVGHFDRAWPHPRLAGAVIAGLLPLAAAVAAGGTVALVQALVPPGGVASVGLVGGVAGAWLSVTTSRRMLLDVARDVLDAASADPEVARETIRALVGRDTSNLATGELRSGAVESAAENLGDGTVAPLLAFALGAQLSVPAAVAAAAWVKAVNTLDSMFGYPSKPHGAASARLDDVVMWVPARASAVLLSLAAADPPALRRAAPWADSPASPNSGWPMATLATIVDVRLTKPGVYTLNEPAALPTDDHARRGVRVVDRAAILAFVLAGVAAWF